MWREGINLYEDETASHVWRLVSFVVQKEYSELQKERKMNNNIQEDEDRKKNDVFSCLHIMKAKIERWLT